MNRTTHACLHNLYSRAHPQSVELEAYLKRPPPLWAGHAVTPLAVYGRQEVLEGEEVEGVAILEFPSFD
jgi:hypothetical protein